MREMEAGTAICWIDSLKYEVRNIKMQPDVEKACWLLRREAQT